MSITIDEDDVDSEQQLNEEEQPEKWYLIYEKKFFP
jgi:hypothetical protein